jgi:serine/threonine protein kinase
MIADQMLGALEFVHSRGFAHCDVKPENFVVGLQRRANQLFVIDFGLARRYRDAATLAHIPYSDGRLLTGTARYASVRVLGGVEPTRRDDIESLAYVLCYFLRGDLPWMGIKAETAEAKNERIFALKKKMTPSEICSRMPDEFRRFLEAARALKFADRPPYEEYRAMFRDLFIRMGYVFDYQFDWVAASKPQTPRAVGVAKRSLAEKPKRVPVIHNPRLVPPNTKRGRNGKKGNQMGRVEKPVPLKELAAEKHPRGFEDRLLAQL